MNQYIIDILYKGVGIGLMGIVCIVSIVGSIKMLRQINKLKDNE
jgi:hypothetical protein